MIGGTIVTWLENTLKLVTPRSRAWSSVSAVDGAVVSNPTAKNTTWRSGVFDRDPQRVERRVHEAHVGALGLGLQQVAVAAGDADHVAERREDDTRGLGDGDRVVDPAHRDDAHRAARPVHQLDGLGQDVLDPVAVDRVRVAAAHLHELEVVVAGEVGDPRHQRACRGGIAVLVDEAHHPPPSFVAASVAIFDDQNASSSSSYAWPINCSEASASAASSSSIFDIAKPTWMSTQSPGCELLVLEQPDVDDPADTAHVDAGEVLVTSSSSTT